MTSANDNRTAHRQWIRAREQRATVGPWELRLDDIDNVLQVESDMGLICELPRTATYDAWFIAKAREDIPRLLDHVELLAAALERFIDPGEWRCAANCDHLACHSVEEMAIIARTALGIEANDES